MARYLFCVYGASGHIHPMIPTALALKAKGHEVAFLTSQAYRSLLEGLGLSYIEPRFWNAALGAQPPLPSNVIRAIQQLLNFARDFSFPQGNNQVKDLHWVKEAWPFDVLVCSDMFLGGALYADLTNCVWATHGAFLSCPLSGPSVPPWGMGLKVARSRWERISQRVSGAVYHFFMRRLSSRWERVRARWGLLPKHLLLAEHVVSPYLYIIPSPNFFDYGRVDLPPQVHHVGPLVWSEPSTVASWEPGFINKDWPLIYGTAGTIYNPLSFIQKMIESVRDQKVNLFITVGKNHSPDELGPLPVNVQLARYVPQHLILKQAVAVICNGGSGATMGAALAGKPMIIVPMISDQPENARRWESLGVARVILPNQLTKESLESAIKLLLEETSLSLRAKEVAAKLALLEASSKSAELLEHLARTSEPVCS